MSTYWARIRGTGLCGPVIVLLGSLWLLHHLLTFELYSFSGVRTEYGPLSWPTFALVMLIVSAGLWCVSQIWRYMRGRAAESPESSNKETPNKGVHDNKRVAAGGCFILLYGLGFAYLGFLLSSILFLVAWMLHGGMRSPFRLAALGVLGTLAPLYLLTKVAYMPLPRGVGVFDTVTVQLYELLGIF